jgi:response regulator receiver domain-containing protein
VIIFHDPSAAFTELPLQGIARQRFSFRSLPDEPPKIRPALRALAILDPFGHDLELQEDLASTIALPIVFITGYGDIPSSVRAMKAGAVEFLSKPFGEEELRQRTLGRRGGTGPTAGGAQTIPGSVPGWRGEVSGKL